MRKSYWLIFAALLLLTLVAAGCSSNSALSERMNAQEAADYLAKHEDAVLLDVREPSEWAQDGRSPEATLISLGELESRASELDKDAPVIVICRSGNRSQTGVQILRNAGFSQVTDVDGGMRSWAAAGLPVECDVEVCGFSQ